MDRNSRNWSNAARICRITEPMLQYGVAIFQDASQKLLGAILFKTVQVLKGKQYLTC